MLYQEGAVSGLRSPADLMQRYSNSATLPPGTWMPQSLWLIGLIFFLFTWLPLLLRSLFALLGGDLAKVRSLAGARTIEEDAADEAAHTAELKPAADLLKD